MGSLGFLLICGLFIVITIGFHAGTDSAREAAKVAYVRVSS